MHSLVLCPNFLQLKHFVLPIEEEAAVFFTSDLEVQAVKHSLLNSNLDLIDFCCGKSDTVLQSPLTP